MLNVCLFQSLRKMSCNGVILRRGPCFPSMGNTTTKYITKAVVIASSSIFEKNKLMGELGLCSFVSWSLFGHSAHFVDRIIANECSVMDFLNMTFGLVAVIPLESLKW